MKKIKEYFLKKEIDKALGTKKKFKLPKIKFVKAGSFRRARAFIFLKGAWQLVLKIPIPAMIVLYFIFITFVFVSINNYRTDQWVSSVQQSCGAAVRGGINEDGTPKLSPVDALYEEFYGREVSLDFSLMGIFFTLFLHHIWMNQNDRKPQVMIRSG